ncbi:MAG: helix-turn-helix domain-containing protein [Treponema sp.]|nr:helix-turn-helix domain-containing protein [Treponema sp.]
MKELSGATGIPKKTLDNYLLSNGNIPSADNAVVIAQTLGVTVEYLITGRNIPGPIMPNHPMSPELRSIAAQVEPLAAKNRKTIEKIVTELAALCKNR